MEAGLFGFHPMQVDAKFERSCQPAGCVGKLGTRLHSTLAPTTFNLLEQICIHGVSMESKLFSGDNDDAAPTAAVGA
jgi:hypothetical protein